MLAAFLTSIAPSPTTFSDFFSFRTLTKAKPSSFMAVAMDNIRGNANQLKGITSTEPLKTSEDTKSPSQSTAPERNDLHLMALPQELQDIVRLSSALQRESS